MDAGDRVELGAILAGLTDLVPDLSSSNASAGDRIATRAA
jgi:hypothetical protein